MGGLYRHQVERNTGTKGGEGLTELQKAIYEFIKEKGKVTREQLIEYFKLSEAELQRQLATLRHCDLVRGHKEGDSIYLVPFNYDEQNTKLRT